MKAFTVCLLGKGDRDSSQPFKELFNGVVSVDEEAARMDGYYMSNSDAGYFGSAVDQAMTAYHDHHVRQGVNEPANVVSVIVTEMK